MFSITYSSTKNRFNTKKISAKCSRAHAANCLSRHSVIAMNQSLFCLNMANTRDSHVRYAKRIRSAIAG